MPHLFCEALIRWHAWCASCYCDSKFSHELSNHKSFPPQILICHIRSYAYGTYVATHLMLNRYVATYVYTYICT